MMLDFILYILFSSLEYSALIYVAFAIYRMSLRYYTYHLVFISLFLSYFSYTLRVSGIDYASSILQMVVLFLFMWLMFRIQIFYAFVVTATGYLVYMLAQGLFILLLIWTGMITFEQVQPSTLIGTSVQVGTAALVMGISRIIEIFHLGFDFVPHSEFSRVKLENKKRGLLVINLLSILSYGLTLIIFMYYRQFSAIYLLLAINLIAMILVFYYARKFDKMEDEREKM